VPILVFVDSGGTFNNDTQCVDGPRGNAADHLTGDVRPYVVARFGASPAPERWGVAGWSDGGTCAADLAVMHPELFGTFEDIAGDLGQAVGDKARTISTLYGGNAAAYARFDPLTVLAGHAHTAGWFENSTGGGGERRFRARNRPPGGFRPQQAGTGLGGRPDPGSFSIGNQAQEAARLCAAMTRDGITCTQHTTPGGHTWQVASTSFSDAFGWLVDRLRPPGPPSVAGSR
jgi:S-formylglutathione hydrolase FrmB